MLFGIGGIGSGSHASTPVATTPPPPANERPGSIGIGPRFIGCWGLAILSAMRAARFLLRRPPPSPSIPKFVTPLTYAPPFIAGGTGEGIASRGGRG